MVPILHDLAIRAREIRERFNDIIKEYDDLNLTNDDGERQIEFASCSLQQQTSSIVHKPSIHGREIDKNNVVEMVLSEERHMSVLAIVGMGGLGKTTLAQLVFNDPRIRQSFDNLAWIFVSEQFDVKIITRNIICSLQKQNCDLVELNDIQGALIEQIKGKKLLLVLYDVWNEHRAPWDSLFAPVMTTQLCRVIVTTRNETVARLVQTMPLYSLNCLSPGESWSLFEQIAFEGQDPAACADFVRIGEGIVEKCRGLPLAIKTLGSMLRYETNEERWKDVLESDLWDLDQPQNDILPALELSYKHMPVFLKRCFIALSLFPKDYHLSQDKVICLWKSLGLLHTDSVGDKDKIGRFYFSELLKRSIIQCNEYAYTMHDLTHDLACCVAGVEFLRLENDIPAEISQDVRNTSIFLPWTGTVSNLQHLHGSNALRAVILSYKDGAGGTIEIPEELFLNSRQLRTIIFDGVLLTKASLPRSMGNLKQLRHLVLRDTGGLRLPISICQLFNLQTIDVTTSCNMKPACIPNGIGHLINLHTLPVITIKRGAWHCNLRELKELQNLSGKFCIKGLENVSSVDEAEEANLCRKQHLQALHLTFPDGDWDHCEHGQTPTATTSHEGILEGLRPHHNIRELSVEVCRSHRYPSWLGDTSFSKLTIIRLEYCDFECLPPLGQLPVLKYLTIVEMSMLGSIGPEFCSLHRRIKGFKSLVALEFDWMPRWLQWSGVEDGEFSCLHTLRIQHALELRFLPFVLSSSLEELQLRDCKSLSRIPYLPSLCKLYLCQCNSLTELPAIPLLHRLDIGQCNSLIRLHDLPSLRMLMLRDCPTLTTVAHFPLLTSIHVKGGFRDELLYSLLNSHTSLENVLIVSESMVHLSLEPQNLASLASLTLSCPNLQHCDGLDGLTSLIELKIYGSPKFNVHNRLPGQL